MNFGQCITQAITLETCLLALDFPPSSPPYLPRSPLTTNFGRRPRSQFESDRSLSDESGRMRNSLSSFVRQQFVKDGGDSQSSSRPLRYSHFIRKTSARRAQRGRQKLKEGLSIRFLAILLSVGCRPSERLCVCLPLKLAAVVFAFTYLLMCTFKGQAVTSYTTPPANGTNLMFDRVPYSDSSMYSFH